MFLDLLDFKDDPKYSLAIVVARNSYGSNHTGILAKQEDEISFYHLAWHLTLEQNKWDDFLENKNLGLKKWVKFISLTEDPTVAELRIPGIIKYLELLYKKSKEKIPYSLRFKETKFTNDGNLSLGENENGLTCATFVVSFFNSVAIELVNLETWPLRDPEDIKWKKFVIEIMNKTNVPLTHIANVSKEEINFRLKPEEIAVSSSKKEDELPTDFTFCSTQGSIFNNFNQA